MSCITWNENPSSPFQTSISFGLTIMIICQIFGGVSGAHLNPAVTIAAYVYKMVDIKLALMYIIAQLMGSLIGYGLLVGIAPTQFLKSYDDSTGIGLCMTMPLNDLSIWQSVVIEFLATSVLIFVNCGVWEPKNCIYGDSVALRIGLTVAALSIAIVS